MDGNTLSEQIVNLTALKNELYSFLWDNCQIKDLTWEAWRTKYITDSTLLEKCRNAATLNDLSLQYYGKLINAYFNSGISTTESTD